MDFNIHGPCFFKNQVVQIVQLMANCAFFYFMWNSIVIDIHSHELVSMIVMFRHSASQKYIMSVEIHIFSSEFTSVCERCFL